MGKRTAYVKIEDATEDACAMRVVRVSGQAAEAAAEAGCEPGEQVRTADELSAAAGLHIGIDVGSTTVKQIGRASGRERV